MQCTEVVWVIASSIHVMMEYSPVAGIGFDTTGMVLNMVKFSIMEKMQQRNRDLKNYTTQDDSIQFLE